MRRYGFRRANSAVLPDDFSTDPVTQLWILRTLLAGDPRRVDAKALAREDEDVLWAAGLSHLWPHAKSIPEADEIRDAAFDRLEKLSVNPPERNAPLDQNLELLSEALQLQPLEVDLLAFGLRLRVSTALTKAFDNREIHNHREAYQNLSWILDASVGEIRRALGPAGSLRNLGLMQITRGRSYQTSLEIMDGLEDVMLTPKESAEELLGEFFQRSPAPLLATEDFAHAGADLELAQRYLRGALAAGTTGVNLLLYGPPGTGKTEFARFLGKSLAMDAFEIRVEDRDGESIDGGRRCGAFRLSQRILARNRRSMIVFDEIEDAFPVQPKRFRSFQLLERDVDKGWLNRLLETNPVPAIWICNATEQLDSAMLRRFDLVIEMRSPPLRGRRKVVEQYLGDSGLPESFLHRVSTQKELAPADIASLGKVAKLASDNEHPEGGLLPLIERALDQRLKLTGHPVGSVAPAIGPPWNKAYVEATPDIEPVLCGLEKSRRGRLLLYGPPGTGKSALARELARRTDLPLLVKPASALLSKWVGDSEKAIAAMFQEAREEGALLLLDEADSFLQDRRNARAAWEVTRVNEMLTQMETYEGLFICTTNLVDGIDDAAFRRFDLKVRFDPLRKPKRLRLLKEACASHALSTSQELRAAALHGLTPGDLAAVLRRFDVLSQPVEPDALLEALEADLRLKSKTLRAPVGF